MSSVFVRYKALACVALALNIVAADAAAAAQRDKPVLGEAPAASAAAPDDASGAPVLPVARDAVTSVVSSAPAPAPANPFHLTEPAPAPRPAALMPLYGSLIGLQALDIDSTMRAIASGAGREANPLMQSVVGRPAALVAVKAGATGAIIFASERLRKTHHPAAAVMLMIGINSAYAMIVAHNYAVANRAP